MSRRIGSRLVRLSFLRRASNNIVYLRGALRTLRRVKPIAKQPNRTVCDLIEDLAVQFGERDALVSDRERLTYAGLSARANQYARWARGVGVAKGGTVGLLMSNRPEYMAAWLGIARAGGATALLNTNQTGAALAHSIKVVGARWAIVEAGFADAFLTALPRLDTPVAVFAHGATLQDWPRIDEALTRFDAGNLPENERATLSINDRCVYVFTSGTTGLPKAANINHYRVLLAMHGFAGATAARASDRLYNCLPMYHTNGGVLAPGAVLAVGGTCFIRERFSSREFWSDIVKHRCTMFMYIGELCRYLVNAPPHADERAHKIRICFGNGLRPDVWPAFRDRFGIRNILEFYGATEGNCSMFNFDSTAGAVGRIPTWAERRFPVKVIRYDVEAREPVRDANGRCVACATDEPGELVGLILDDPGKPGNRFEGYADAAATEKKVLRDAFAPGDAWFRTGDLLRRDADGYYYFVDRIGDTFRRKGENVSTSEVAEALSGFPGIREINVYGVPVPGVDGKVGMASLIVDDHDALDLAGLYKHCAAGLADYARPVFLRLPARLEVTGTFKQRKVELAAEGFDPARIGDPLFVADVAVGRYVPLDAGSFQKIMRGQFRL